MVLHGERADGGDVDDRCALAVAQACLDCFSGPDGRGDGVDLEHLGHDFCRLGHDWAEGGVGACVVDEDIEGAEGVGGEGTGGCGGLGIGNVRGGADDAAGVGVDGAGFVGECGGGGLDGVFLAAGDEDVGAGGCEQPGGGVPDAACAAGDHGGAVCEVV